MDAADARGARASAKQACRRHTVHVHGIDGGPRHDARHGASQQRCAVRACASAAQRLATALVRHVIQTSGRRVAHERDTRSPVQPAYALSSNDGRSESQRAAAAAADAHLQLRLQQVDRRDLRAQPAQRTVGQRSAHRNLPTALHARAPAAWWRIQPRSRTRIWACRTAVAEAPTHSAARRRPSARAVSTLRRTCESTGRLAPTRWPAVKTCP